MDIPHFRKRIDVLDRRLVRMLNERARAAQLIGRLKRTTNLPIYEPRREQVIMENIRRHNRGPLTDRQLTNIYRRIVRAMRELQRSELVDDMRKSRPSRKRS